MRDNLNIDTSDLDGKIAIIGLAGQFPEAKDVEQFWKNIAEGRESIRRLDPKRVAASGIDMALLEKDNYVDAFGWLEDIDLFDANFFAMSPREAEIRDPQHRLLLETSYLALESAGYSANNFNGDIALFTGTGTSGYLYKNLLPRKELVDMFGVHSLVLSNDKDYASTFVSYKLNLTGASLNINTGCSSSLVSVHYAMQSLLNFESDMVMAGGASINSDQDIGYHYTEGGIHPPDGHVRPFDANALGTIGGSGAGIVVMKRLEDAINDGDHIHGILLASAVNNDGSGKIGYTAPSVYGQSRVIQEALNVAQIDASHISYVEAHGTGTALGDPIEIQALTDAYQQFTDKRHYCAIGSLKSNIGHLGAASGVSGLIKVLLAMKNKQLPASLNFSDPNPEIDFETSPFYVNDTLRPWFDVGPLYAGVSSFGIGGTNAHVIVQSASPARRSNSDEPQLLVLSAKSRWSLTANRQRLAQFIEQNPEFSLSDIAYTLQSGRQRFEWCTAVAAKDRDCAIELLQRSTINQVSSQMPEKTVVMFPGQGSQYLAMGKDLYLAGGVFKEAVDHCCAVVFDETQTDLLPFFIGEELSLNECINDTIFAQPLLFIIEYAYVRKLQSKNVVVNAYIGHSIGEYVAACLSGVFSLADALKLVCARGRLMFTSPEGAMLAVRVASHEIYSIVIESGLEFAAINSRSHCVVSGKKPDIELLAKSLTEQNIHCRMLKTGHAFHSKFMEPVLPDFEHVLENVTFNTPTVPFISNLTGQWISADDACSKEYWLKHLRGCVNFSSGLNTLFDESFKWFIEAGPGNSLSTFVNSHKYAQADVYAIALGRDVKREEHDDVVFIEGLALLWQTGGHIDFSTLYSERRYKVPLPNYQFEQKYYWATPPQFNVHASHKASIEVQEKQEHESLGEFKSADSDLHRQLCDIWQTCFSIDVISIDDNFYQLGGDSLLATRVVSRIKQQFSCKLELNDFMKAPTIEGIAQHLIKMGVQETKQRVVGEI